MKQRKSAEIFVRRICAGIRDPKVRRAAEQEYLDHIEDAVYHAALDGMKEEEALEQAFCALGAPENYSDLLADVHAEEPLPPEWEYERRRQLLIWCIFGCLIAAAVCGAWFLWGNFVWQLIALGIAAWLLLLTGRLLLAFSKRVRAVIRLKKAAKEGGYSWRMNATVFTSLLLTADVPSVTLENGERVYKIRFVTTLGKNRVLRFFGRNLYTVSVVRGGMMLNHRHPFKGVGLFHRNPLPRFHYATHTDLAECGGNVRTLPVLERRFDDKTKITEEVLIFNPAPMRIHYRQKNSDITILGGETVDGIQMHDVTSFCSLLTR